MLAESIEEEEQTNEADACFYDDTQDEFEEEVNNVDMLEQVEPFVIGGAEEPPLVAVNSQNMMAQSLNDENTMQD